MQHSTPQGRLTRFVRARWPLYLFGYLGTTIFLLMLIWISLQQGWFAFVLLSSIALFIIAMVAIVSLRTANKVYDNVATGRSIVTMCSIQPNWTIVDINVGELELAVWLSRQLLTGKVLAIDVYNPQLAPSRTLSRNRRFEVRPADDPRLSIRQGSTSLLPLPDNCTPLVTAVRCLSELWQEGDKHQLLKEIYRVLEPGGHLLVGEQMVNRANILSSGPSIPQLKTATHWQQLLEQAGFKFHGSEQTDAPLTFLMVQKRN